MNLSVNTLLISSYFSSIERGKNRKCIWRDGGFGWQSSPPLPCQVPYAKFFWTFSKHRETSYPVRIKIIGSFFLNLSNKCQLVKLCWFMVLSVLIKIEKNGGGGRRILKHCRLQFFCWARRRIRGYLNKVLIS